MDCNEIQVNLFSKESYMDKKEVMAIWNPDFILKYHMESVKSVDKLARQARKGRTAGQSLESCNGARNGDSWIQNYFSSATRRQRDELKNELDCFSLSREALA